MRSSRYFYYPMEECRNESFSHRVYYLTYWSISNKYVEPWRGWRSLPHFSEASFSVFLNAAQPRSPRFRSSLHPVFQGGCATAAPSRGIPFAQERCESIGGQAAIREKTIGERHSRHGKDIFCRKYRVRIIQLSQPRTPGSLQGIKAGDAAVSRPVFDVQSCPRMFVHRRPGSAGSAL